MQVSPRLLTAPARSACLSKREWLWRAPAPVTRLAMGVSKCLCHAALRSRCSKYKYQTFQRHHPLPQVPLPVYWEASTSYPPRIWPDISSSANCGGRSLCRPRQGQSQRTDSCDAMSS
eukprot:4251218-Pyramimonas_sp.AAC.1